ncbi:hypothetical protein GF386_03750 [Candidatus Pacearchaeota archaeon]|nr:hypothetical protein [Candidatus Pacearchaeota archaeon]MBD3283266.1 hypothetical protein [Candidatus Pacearchaeota archaeon]
MIQKSFRNVALEFVIADAFKEPASGHREIGIDRLTEKYKRVRAAYESLTDEHLRSLITWKPRLNWFESREWYKKEVELSKMGVWPEMQGLNVRLTT